MAELRPLEGRRVQDDFLPSETRLGLRRSLRYPRSLGVRERARHAA